jgi:hypothetical protein
MASTLPQADWYFSDTVQGLHTEFENFPSLLFWVNFG